MDKFVNASYQIPVMESGVITLLGMPDSGKTTQLAKIIKGESEYARKFDFYLIISPSAMPGIEFDEQFCSRSLNLAWLSDRLQLIAQVIDDENQNNQQKKVYKILIVFDDVIADLKKYGNNQVLNRLFYNRRHIVPGGIISIAVATQQFTRTPTLVRATSTHYILCQQQMKDMEDFRKECTSLSKREFQDTVVSYLSGDGKPHLFVVMNPFTMFDDRGNKKILESDQLKFERGLTQKISSVVKHVIRDRTPMKENKSANVVNNIKRNIDLNDLFNIR